MAVHSNDPVPVEKHFPSQPQVVQIWSSKGGDIRLTRTCFRFADALSKRCLEPLVQVRIMTDEPAIGFEQVVAGAYRWSLPRERAVLVTRHVRKARARGLQVQQGAHCSPSLPARLSARW